jgi:asparagine N-glycosylation enzyme membrane subunit Stt3
MQAPLPYIAISVAALLVLAVLAYATARSRRPGRLTPLAGLAFVFILAGILFGEQRLLGYGLMGFGVLLALIDIINKSRGAAG